MRSIVLYFLNLQTIGNTNSGLIIVKTKKKYIKNNAIQNIISQYALNYKSLQDFCSLICS